MTRIVIIWIIPETTCLFRGNTQIRFPMHLLCRLDVMFKNFNMCRDENLLPFLPPIQGSLTPTWYMSHVQRVEDVQKASFTFNLKIQHLFVTAVRLQPAELTGQLNIFSFVSSMISSLNNLSILYHLILWWISDDSYFEIVWHFLFCSNTNSLEKRQDRH